MTTAIQYQQHLPQPTTLSDTHLTPPVLVTSEDTQNATAESPGKSKTQKKPPNLQVEAAAGESFLF